MNRARRARLVIAALLLAGAPASAAGRTRDNDRGAPALAVFTLESGRVSSPPGVPAGPLPIGSLAKPFVARAWALAHPGSATPVVRCSPASRCWNASGHGTVGLVRATAVSCNTYFRAIAADTPAPTLAATLRAAGLLPPDPLSPEAAIGLSSAPGLVSAEPGALLRAYAALVREPWDAGEPVRRELLAGLRDSAHEGTAAGLAGFGFHAKTGTVPAIDGRPLSTSGWVIAVDESGRGFLGLLTPGTGREAARGLASRLRGDEARDGTHDDRRLPAPTFAAEPRGAPPRLVRVSLFSALAPRRVRARNAGSAPVSGSRGFVGPGGSLDLRPGDRLEAGDWELTLPGPGLRRVVRGAVRADAGPRDVLRVRADVTLPEYVAGVIAAELASPDAESRVALAAAVLRFLADGPRHGDSDVCDLTHCAFFVGRGPRAAWPSPGRAVVFDAAGRGERRLSRAGRLRRRTRGAASWRRRTSPAPTRWTSHCGGEPLSPHAVWGGPDRRRLRLPAPRAGGPRALDPGVGSTPTSSARSAAGSTSCASVRTTGSGCCSRDRDGAPLRLTWDEAHARLAAVLGWGALPSPADRVVRETDGFRATGRGLGHRVGLCLAATPAPPAGGSRPLLD